MATGHAGRKKSIAIIGAGPSGLCALKSVLDREEYKRGEWDVVVFEAREDVCGVWLPAEPTSLASPPTTPMYDSLTTNLPHPVMSFPSFPFPPGSPLFPEGSAVLRYLQLYVRYYNLRPHIRLNTRVVNVDWNKEDGRWVVETNGEPNDREGSRQEHRDTTHADLVIISNGHYSLPRFPTTPGIHEWVEKGIATHAMWYRRPPPPPSELPSSPRVIKILIIGAGPSGQDLVADFLSLQPSPSYSYTVIHSTTAPVSESVPQANGNLLLRRPCVSLYHSLASASTSTVGFENGEVEDGIDHVYLATGYSYTYPFLPPHIMNEGYPPPLPAVGDGLRQEGEEDGEGLWNTCYGVHHLARHVWPISLNSPSSLPYPSTSLAFLALPFLVAPFPLVDAQARAVVAAFSNPGLLNVEKEVRLVKEMYREAGGEVTGVGNAGGNDPEERHIWGRWHVFRGGSEQFDYGDFLPAGSHNSIPAWHMKVYEAKNVLRQRWRALEGANDWVRYVEGVGSDGWDEERGGYEGDDSAKEAERVWEGLLWKVLEEGRGTEDIA